MWYGGLIKDSSDIDTDTDDSESYVSDSEDELMMNLMTVISKVILMIVSVTMVTILVMSRITQLA